ALLDTDAVPAADWLRQCSFQYTTDLLYLVSLREKFPSQPPATELVFRPLAEKPGVSAPAEQLTRLAQIVQRTYVDTLDCPTIQGLRNVDDVLSTYKSVGIFDASRWFFVQHDNADVGCLLLADHPHHQNCELVYMGIVPEARGHGWG